MERIEHKIDSGYLRIEVSTSVDGGQYMEIKTDWGERISMTKDGVNAVRAAIDVLDGIVRRDHDTHRHG